VRKETVFGDLDESLKYAPDKFTLVNMVTKRAKQLNNGAPSLAGEANPNKPVSTAFIEVGMGLIHYKQAKKEGVK
jgi:DNA-directed RNA polymerase omega subunit